MFESFDEWMNEKKELDKDQVFDKFEEEILPEVIKKYGKDDKPAIRQAFNDFVDALAKDGEIDDDLRDEITLSDRYDPELKDLVIDY